MLTHRPSPGSHRHTEIGHRLDEAAQVIPRREGTHVKEQWERIELGIEILPLVPTSSAAVIHVPPLARRTVPHQDRGGPDPPRVYGKVVGVGQDDAAVRDPLEEVSQSSS